MAKKISERDSILEKVAVDGGVCKSEDDVKQLFKTYNKSSRALQEALKNHNYTLIQSGAQSLRNQQKSLSVFLSRNTGHIG